RLRPDHHRPGRRLGVSGLITLDLVVAVLAATAWLGAAAAAALAPDTADPGRRRPASSRSPGVAPKRRPGLVATLVALAVLASVARVVTVSLLLRGGWWFAAEKVLVGLPLLL